MVYPALLPLMLTPRLPVVDLTDAPADLNGLVRLAERRNMVSARVPSHFKRSLPHSYVLLAVWSSDTIVTPLHLLWKALFIFRCRRMSRLLNAEARIDRELYHCI